MSLKYKILNVIHIKINAMCVCKEREKNVYDSSLPWIGL